MIGAKKQADYIKEVKYLKDIPADLQELNVKDKVLYKVRGDGNCLLVDPKKIWTSTVVSTLTQSPSPYSRGCLCLTRP